MVLATLTCPNGVIVLGAVWDGISRLSVEGGGGPVGKGVGGGGGGAYSPVLMGLCVGGCLGRKQQAQSNGARGGGGGGGGGQQRVERHSPILMGLCA